MHKPTASSSISPILRSVIAAHPALSRDAEVRLTTDIVTAHTAAWLACLGPECVRATRRAALLAIAASVCGADLGDAPVDLQAMPLADVAALAERCRLGLDHDQHLLRATQAAALTECDDVRTSPRASSASVARAEKWRARILATAAALARLEDRMVKHNLGLVTMMAARRRTKVCFDDLVQQGCIGLLSAVRRFDSTRGFRFSTPAAWWVRHAIGRYIEGNDRTVRLPVHMKEAIAAVRKADGALYDAATCTPASDEQVAAHTGLDVEKVAMARITMQDGLSLSTPLVGADEPDFTVEQTIADPGLPDPVDAIDLHALKTAVRTALIPARPMTRDAHVVAAYYGLDGDEPMTLHESGASVGLSRERVRQINAKAYASLRPVLAAYA